MGIYRVTHHMEDLYQDLLSPSLFTQLILWSGGWTHHDSINMALRWSADMGRDRVLLTLGSSIALAIHSLDPLECRRGEESCSIDISQDLLSHSLRDLYRGRYPLA